MQTHILASFMAFFISISMSGCSMFGGPAAEEPLFTVVTEQDNFQIRNYETYTIAETVVDETFHSATQTAFNRLFDYISGANKNASKIEMTAPVLVIPQGIAMISSTQSNQSQPTQESGIMDQSQQGWTIAFVLPQGMNTSNSPKPLDTRIRLIDVPERQVATLQFSGRLRTAPVELHRAKLAAWLDGQGMDHQGDWRVAGYNPPWTLPALRRNEIQVTLIQSS
ncbi:MAG: heme-binding protein [Gammaproteobacteria bacterium]|nr:heme-binding protein [Gammaproteobacteria bacterium]MCY4219608.1 heme-binding protein [Gammaproteobacteria bacterium]MCY4275489.1 heme-binding protein [Gammaproteobacteria bacterium]